METSFEYDPDKNRINKVRHGIGLDEAPRLWDLPHMIVPARHVQGEHRFVILAVLGDRLYAAVFTYRDSAIRLISCHKADKRWQNQYKRHLDEKETR